MSLRDEIRTQNNSANEMAKLLSVMVLASILSDTKQTDGFGTSALLAGMLMGGNSLDSAKLGDLHSWHDSTVDLFNRRVDMWLEKGRWGQNNNLSQNPIENILATPGFFGNRKSR